MVNNILTPVGNPLTGYELGSTWGSQALAVNAVPGSTILDFANFNTVTIQWRTTGSMAGSVLGGNDGTNFVLLSTTNMAGAQTTLVGFTGSALPRYLQLRVGSANGATVTGSGFCDFFAKAQ